MPQQQKIASFPTSKRERRRLLRRSRDGRLRAVSVLRPLCGWLLVISVIVFASTNYRLFAPENLRRFVDYARVGFSAASGDISTIPFDTGTTRDSVLFSGGLAVADSDSLYIKRPGGVTRLTEQLSYSAIALSASDDAVLAYDRGGTGITIASGASILLRKELSSPILSAAIANNNSFSVVTDEQGYKSAVTVYDASGDQTYKWSSSEYYIQSAALSPSGNKLAALVFLPDGTALESRLLFFEVGQEEAPAVVTLGAALGIEARFLSEDAVAVLCDTDTFIVRENGKIIAQQSYAADDLQGYAITDGTVAVATRSYRAGARTEIYLIKANGKISLPLHIEDELQSVSVSEHLLAVLTTSGLQIYDHELKLLRGTKAATGGKRVLLQDDGTAYVLFGKQAQLYTLGQMEAQK